MGPVPLSAPTCKDFITCNALRAIASKRSEVKEEPVDFLNKTGYGQVPNYILRAKQRRQKTACSPSDKQDQNADHSELLPGERNNLLRHLKVKWGELNAAFQKLPLQLDTPSKIRRKDWLELSLSQTEADIQLLQHNHKIVILGD